MSLDSYIPFSQRNGLTPVPPQLQIGEISADLRRLLFYYIDLEIEQATHYGYDRSYFDGKWKRVAMDFHVIFLKQDISTYENSPYELKDLLEKLIKKAEISLIFDLIEFLIRHQGCSPQFKVDIANALIQSRAAYRIIGSQIIAIGTEQQAAAFEKALIDSSISSPGARQHLLAAGLALRSSDWPGSVRESIHAVEAVAVKLAPNAGTLGAALSALEKQGHLHGSLKAAFGSLYGYSSDEEGVRHALVFKDAAQVDEADALFMLGACASFVSYLLARAPA